MKKLFIIFAVFFTFFCFFNVNFASAEADTFTFVVTANKANVYEEASFSSTVLKTLSHKDEVKIEISMNKPVEYTSGSYVFYKIDGSGYILSDLICQKTKTITSIPNFNAKTNEECFVYFFDNELYTKSEIKLAKNQEIFLYKGYDKNAELTAVAFVYKNEVYYGFLQTKNISPNGINPVVITVITLVMAILGIAFAWVFIQGKKKKKMA